MALGVAPAEGSEIGGTEAVITASYFSKTLSSGLNARCGNERRPHGTSSKRRVVNLLSWADRAIEFSGSGYDAVSRLW